jgi:bifunctional ADP-heptose synthase (sugar kinase/adenylyltransferase)
MLRAEAIASLACIDYVAINEWPTAEETLRLLRPNIYVKGSEFKNTAHDITGKIGREDFVVREIGAELRFTEDIVFSSSTLINRHLSHFSQEIQEYLSIFRARHSLDSILGALDSLSDLNVLVVGDAIIDEYHYCEAIGKSSKDPCLAMKYQSHDLFAGGAMAVANHTANFARRVDLLTTLGDRDSCEEFIRSKLQPNVTPHFYHKLNAPTTVKRRYIDGYSFSKLFEIYVFDDSELPFEIEDSQNLWLTENLKNYDVVIAADFGHSAISTRISETLVQNAPFLSVMTQANAGNRGFNTVTKYNRADFVCIAEHEIRMETRDLSGRLRPMITSLAGKLDCDCFVVTRGRKGCMIGSKDEKFVQVPTFASRVVDRVGAGDAFLSVTSLLTRLGVDYEVVGFVGNVVGSLAVEVIGNTKPIDKLSVKKFVTSLLK